MPDLSAWGVGRAEDTAARITAQPVSIVVIRDGAKLDAQTVRVEPLGLPGQQRGENATVANTGVLITGYKDHATIADTDLRRGDRFVVDGQMITVTAVLVVVPGRLVAIAEASE